MTALQILRWRAAAVSEAECVIRDEIEDRASRGLSRIRNPEARTAAFDAAMNLWIVVHEHARQRREAA